MSRIGKKPVAIPQGVTVTVTPEIIEIKGPKGVLTVKMLTGITVKVEDNNVIVDRKNDEKQIRAFHGLIRSLVNNSIIGVSEGYTKTLKLVGTGYRAKAQGAGVSLAVGYSHPVEIKAADGITIKVEGTDTIRISGIDKQAVGEMAANIRKVRSPEPYKGKGIRYEDEVVRRKQGKAAA